jgi:hypothetical protein
MVPEAHSKITVVGGGVSGGNGLPFHGPVTAIPRSFDADVPLLPENHRGSRPPAGLVSPPDP